MRKLIVVLLTLVLVSSCGPGRIDVPKEVMEGKIEEINYLTANDSIHFDFSAEWLSDVEGNIPIMRYGVIVKVKATLFNDNADTVYFLTSSCYKDRDNLQYDRDKFQIYPDWACNIHIPILQKILPGGRYYFEPYFLAIPNTTTIKLGYNFDQFDKDYNGEILLRHRGLYTLDNVEGYSCGYKRTPTIVWANEKTIE